MGKKHEWLDDQIAFNNAMDVQRMAPLLNRICDAVGHDDYEAAVEEALGRLATLRQIKNLLHDGDAEKAYEVAAETIF